MGRFTYNQILILVLVIGVLFYITSAPSNVFASCNINWIYCPPIMGDCAPQDPALTNETTMTQIATEEFIEIFNSKYSFGMSTASCNEEYCSAIGSVSYLIDPSMDYEFLMKVYYDGGKAGIYEFEPYSGGGIMPLPGTWEVDCDPDADEIENDGTGSKKLPQPV